MLPRRILVGIAVVVDVALLGRSQPVAAKLLAERQGRPPRHLEPLLRHLVAHGFLKGTRGPRGGYELARERRRITLGAIARSLASDPAEMRATPTRIIETILLPTLADADAAYLTLLDRLSIQDITAAAEAAGALKTGASPAEFHI